MPFKKQNLPVNTLEHLKGNKYRIRRKYKNSYNSRYYYKVKCFICGNEMYQDHTNFIKNLKPTCSRECQNQYIPRLYNKFGKGKNKYKPNGYVLSYAPTHPNSHANHVLEHRLVMEKHLKRYLDKEEKIHHINFIKNDNRLKNLILYKTTKEHNNIHNSAMQCISELLNKGVVFFDLKTKTYKIT